MELALLVGALDKRPYLMEVMTVVTCGRILITGSHTLTMNRVPVHGFLVMALDTLGDSNLLVTLPVGMNMNISVTVSASDPFLYMNTVVMLGIFFLVAALAGDLVNLGIPAHMLGKIGNFHMAACTAVLPMDRCRKGGNGHLVAVTTQTGCWVDCHSLFGKGWYCCE